MSNKKSAGIGLSISPEVMDEIGRKPPRTPLYRIMRQAHIGLSGTDANRIEHRLRLWAETRTDNALADDILTYIDETNEALNTAYNAFSLVKDDLSESNTSRDALLKALQAIPSTMERMKAEGRLIPLCKQFTFKPDNGGWLVGVPKEKSVFFYDMKGFQYIHKLISNPNKRIDCTELEGLHKAGVHIPDDMPVTDNKYLTSIKLNREQLDENYKRALRRDDLEAAARFDNEITELDENINKLTNKKGKPRITGEHDKSRSRVKHAISKAMAKIKTEAPALYGAIKPHLHTGLECFFSGSSDWNI